MSNENIVREWFGAVRAAADKAEEMLADPPARNTPARVKTDILLRHYLRDGLGMYIVQSEGIRRMQAEEICENIYSELIEDAMAGIWAPNDSVGFMRFLTTCTNAVCNSQMFRELLSRALDADVTEREAKSVMETADQELAHFAAERKARR